MIPADLLPILCCPETHQPVRLAEATLIDSLNQRIASGALKSRGGQLIKEKLDSGLVRQDGQFLYPVRRDIPVMLVEEAIPLTL